MGNYNYRQSSHIIREMDRFVHLQSISDLNFIRVENLDSGIIFNYRVTDPDLKNKYDFQVENILISELRQIQFQKPTLKLLSPKIGVNLDIHMLMQGEICYTFPGDILYNKGLTCGYAVEQSVKWAFGYEFYLKKGFWPFKEMPHGIYPIHWGFFRPGIAA
jgi:hypothetical protein